MNQFRFTEYRRDEKFRPVVTLVTINAGSTLGFGMAHFNPKDGVPVKKIGRDLAASRAIAATKIVASLSLDKELCDLWNFSTVVGNTIKPTMFGIKTDKSATVNQTINYLRLQQFFGTAECIRKWTNLC